MPFNRQPAVNTGRGNHPDLTAEGDVAWDVQQSADPRVRTFNREYFDAQRRDAFMANLAAEQAQDPVEVQAYIQGRTYAPDGTPHAGYVAYQADREWARQEYARQQGFERYVDDRDVAKMSDAEYDSLFDERGQPRAHVLFRTTNRAVRIDDAMDPQARMELRRP